MAVQFVPPLVLLNTPPSSSSSIEGLRCLRINGKGIDMGVGEAGIHGSPVRSTIGALEHTTTVSSSIEGVRCLRINGKGTDIGVGEAGIDGSPVRSTIGALEYTTTTVPA